MTENTEKKKLSSVCQLWRSGTTLVVAIPRRIREMKEAEKGDLIEVFWGDIIEKASSRKSKKTKKEIEEEEEIEEIKEDIERGVEENQEDLPEMD